MAVCQELAQLRMDFQDMLQIKEEQEELLHHTERQFSALKGALKEEVETHDKYTAALKEEYEQELEKLLRDLEQSKEVRGNICSDADGWSQIYLDFNRLHPVLQSNALLGHGKAEAEEERGAAKLQLKELIQERDHLKGKVRELNNKVEQLSQAIQEFKTTERLMEQRAKQLEVGAWRNRTSGTILLYYSRMLCFFVFV